MTPLVALLLGLGAILAGSTTATASARPAVIPPAGMPIQHVVVIYQENHTFDNLLGGMCVQQANRCNGVTSGLAGALTVPLAPATDIVPAVDHSVGGQAKATDGGKMDDFNLLNGCTAPAYACYTQATQAEIPNLWSLATNYAISDNTFAQTPVMSWEQHIQLGALTYDGFSGNNPSPDPALTGIIAPNGWGCAGANHVRWGLSLVWQAPCIPTVDGTTPSGATLVPYVPDFYDNVLAANGVSYRLYGALYDGTKTTDNVWSPGGAFATWRYGPQYAVTAARPKAILTDIAAGTLPQVSFVTPSPINSQHNTNSLLVGDNYIGSIVSAVQASPYWASTAIVIAYDDCGCFYDHVAPPAGMGMRTPLVIVSPYAKAGFVDQTQASFAPSDLAFIEWVFGLPPLTATSPDNGAYTWQNSFDFTQVPLAPVTMKTSIIPAASLRYAATHPASAVPAGDS